MSIVPFTTQPEIDVEGAKSMKEIAEQGGFVTAVGSALPPISSVLQIPASALKQMTKEINSKLPFQPGSMASARAQMRGQQYINGAFNLMRTMTPAVVTGGTGALFYYSGGRLVNSVNSYYDDVSSIYADDALNQDATLSIQSVADSINAFNMTGDDITSQKAFIGKMEKEMKGKRGKQRAVKFWKEFPDEFERRRKQLDDDMILLMEDPERTDIPSRAAKGKGEETQESRDDHNLDFLAEGIRGSKTFTSGPDVIKEDLQNFKDGKMSRMGILASLRDGISWVREQDEVFDAITSSNKSIQKRKKQLQKEYSNHVKNMEMEMENIMSPQGPSKSQVPPLDIESMTSEQTEKAGIDYLNALALPDQYNQNMKNDIENMFFKSIVFYTGKKIMLKRKSQFEFTKRSYKSRATAPHVSGLKIIFNDPSNFV